LLPALNLVTQIIEYNGFIDAYAVQIGWPLVRDLSNMFFVVILLIIAFSTILHISSYHYKNTLLKLVIMALLVNFSKLIVGFMIDFAQVIMLTFVNAFRAVAVASLANVFGLDKVGKVLIKGAAEATKSENSFGTVVLNFIFLVVACGVMIAYIAVLLYRIIALWVLVILSPFAFFAAAFPGLKKYSSEYWTKFIGQLSVGIMLAFFLWLAFQLFNATTVGQADLISQFGASAEEAEHKELWERVYTFVISIAFLMLGLQYAQQAGGFAGSFAGKVSGKLSDWSSRAIKGTARVATAPLRGARDLGKMGVKKGLGLAERKLLDVSTAKGEKGSAFRQGLKYLTKAGWQGFGKRSENLLEKSRAHAGAYAYDQANNLMTGGKLKTSHGINESERQYMEGGKEYKMTGPEDAQKQFSDALSMADGREKDDKIRQIFAVASGQAWVDDLMKVQNVMVSLMGEGEQKKVATQIAKKEGLKGKEAEDRVEALTKNEGQGLTEYTDQKIWKASTKNIDVTSREKYGNFFRKIATSTETGELSQEGLNLVYAHEENAKKNGHLADLGFVRAAEEDGVDERGNKHKKGELRLLGYLNEGRNEKTGLTEADEMGINEVMKMDQTAVARAQRHSFGHVRSNGKLGMGGAYHRQMIELAGGSQGEAHRISSVGRTRQNLLGGTAVHNPKVEIKLGDLHIGAVKIDEDVLADVMARLTFVNGRKYVGNAYGGIGGTFIKNKSDNGAPGEVKDTRAGLSTAGNNMIFKIDDLKRQQPLKEKLESERAGLSEEEITRREEEISGLQKTIGVDAVTGVVSEVDEKTLTSKAGSQQSIEEFLDSDMVSDDVKQEFAAILATPGFGKQAGEPVTGAAAGESAEEEMAEPAVTPAARQEIIREKESERDELIREYHNNEGNMSEEGKKEAKEQIDALDQEIASEQGRLNYQMLAGQEKALIGSLDELTKKIDEAMKNGDTKGAADLKTSRSGNVKKLADVRVKMAVSQTTAKLGQKKDDWIHDPTSRTLFIKLLREELKRSAGKSDSLFRLMEEEIGKDIDGLVDEREMQGFLARFGKK
jgi:hypothetical protein